MNSSASSAIPPPNPTSAAWSTYMDNQNLNVPTLYGNTTSLPLAAINQEIYLFKTREAVYGMEIGATRVTLLVILIFADSKKLRSPLSSIFSTSLYRFSALLLRLQRMTKSRFMDLVYGTLELRLSIVPPRKIGLIRLARRPI